MTDRVFSSEEKAKLTQLINEGLTVMQEVDDLNGGLKDTVKAIAEEVRGLAIEFNVPIWSATQVTRGGFNSSDVELTDTSESFGLPATADLMLAMISTEQLEGMNQVMFKQLKNRYNDPTKNKRFVVGIDRSKICLLYTSDAADD